MCTLTDWKIICGVLEQPYSWGEQMTGQLSSPCNNSPSSYFETLEDVSKHFFFYPRGIFYSINALLHVKTVFFCETMLKPLLCKSFADGIILPKVRSKTKLVGVRYPTYR